MINIRTIRKLQNNDGLTLKRGKKITYKSGWQVADYGKAFITPEETIQEVRRMGGNCGVWLENGIYYVDHSFRVNTKREAMEIGRAHNQISVLRWKDMGLAYCQNLIHFLKKEVNFFYLFYKNPLTNLMSLWYNQYVLKRYLKKGIDNYDNERNQH